MSTQASKRAVEFRVKWLNEALGRPVEAWTKIEGGCKGNAGNFHLDHGIGGWRVEEMLATGGAHPTFGHQRMSKGELCNHLDAILKVLRITEPASKALQACLDASISHRWKVNSDEADCWQAARAALERVKGGVR